MNYLKKQLVQKLHKYNKEESEKLHVKLAISHEMALQLAETEYDKYNAERIKADDLKALEELDKKINQLKLNNQQWKFH